VTERSNLAHGTWAEAEALVGHELLRQEGPDALTLADIRRKLEVIGWDCPLHTDAATARAHGYEDVVSPVSMTRVLSLPAYWRPGEPRIGTQPQIPGLAGTRVPGEGDALIATGVRMDYHEPIHPGDRIAAVAVLESLERKTTRVGAGAFFVVRTTYTKQDGAVVAVETVTFFRYQREGDGA
jgi:acyl dehydratase